MTERTVIMEKSIKCVSALFFSLLMLFSAIVPARADQPDNEPVSPMYAVPIDVNCWCNISDDLTLYATCTYGAAANSQVSRVDITIYVEKRNLLIFWDRIDIGQPNNEWVTICYGLSNDTSHSAQLTSTGTYRATYIFEVYSGTTLIDTIEKTVTVSC